MNDQWKRALHHLFKIYGPFIAPGAKYPVVLLIWHHAARISMQNATAAAGSNGGNGAVSRAERTRQRSRGRGPPVGGGTAGLREDCSTWERAVSAQERP